MACQKVCKQGVGGEAPSLHLTTSNSVIVVRRKMNQKATSNILVYILARQLYSLHKWAG